MFSTVIVNATCEKCGRSHQQDCQFKTGHDHALPVATQGGVIADVPPGDYEGVVDRLCKACMPSNEERGRAVRGGWDPLQDWRVTVRSDQTVTAKHEPGFREGY